MVRNSVIAIVLLGAFVLFGGSLAALTMTAGFRYHHPRAPNAEIVDRNGRLIVLNRSQAQIATPLPDYDKTKPPKAVLDKTDYDFGVLPPHSSVSHAFKIRNEGEGPLQLEKGKTSCKCAFAGVPDGVIPPGGEAEIKLFWNTGGTNSYRQTAIIKTNDPVNPRFRLTVRGEIEVLTALEPEELHLERLEPGKKHAAGFFAYSRKWDAFQIEDLACTIEGAVVDAKPADLETLKLRNAKAGWWVTVALPEMEPGRFNGAIRGKMVPAQGDDASRPIDVQVSGRVLRRLSVYGSAIDGAGIVTLGVVEQGEVKTAQLYMKVKDDITDLPISSMSVEPNYLNVAVKKPEKSSFKGLYSLTIENDKGAPVSSHLGDRHGIVRFEFDHPRIQELELHVRFAVLAKESN